MNSEVKEIIVENNQTVGVRLSSGEVIKSHTVLTNCTDHVTFNQLLNKNVALDPEFVKVTFKYIYMIKN